MYQRAKTADKEQKKRLKLAVNTAEKNICVLSVELDQLA